MRKAVVLAIAIAWLALLTVTHYGGRSPYSYGWAMFPWHNQTSEYLNGAVVNPDALSVRDVVLFFYDARPVDWPNAHNLALPLHAVVVSTFAGLTRGYLTSSYLANVLFFSLIAVAGLNLADRFAIRRSVTLATLLIFFSLPIVLDYVGQPLHYVVGMCGNFLVILAVVALDEKDARNPWIAALGVSILTLNYDPWIFLGALLAWFLLVRRFGRWWHAAAFLIAAAIPKIAWTQFLRVSSDGQMSKHLHKTFIEPALLGWQEMLTDPVGNLLQPFVASHIGVHVALHQIVAMIYWPLLAVCLWLLIRLHPRLGRPWILIALLPVFLLLEQMAAAAWDWELNPRRAIPVVLAFGVAFCWSANQVWDHRRWRVGVVALIVLCAFLAMADVVVRDPAMAFLRMGQAMTSSPQEAINQENKTLLPYYMPKLQRDRDIEWRELDGAKVAPDRWREFAAGQVVTVYLLIALFWLTARAKILPRWSPHVAIAIWALSMLRFV